MYGSRYLTDQLHRLGFCSSYYEVQNFEQSAAFHLETDVAGILPDSCIQFIADNVDHNTRTLDGTGTFHGMGIIASATPGTQYLPPIPRGKFFTAKTFTQIGKIPLHYFDASSVDYHLHMRF